MYNHTNAVENDTAEIYYNQSNNSDVDSIQEAKDALPAAIMEFIAAYNKKHYLEVTTGAMEFASESLPEICQDLYAGRAVTNPQAIQSTDRILMGMIESVVSAPFVTRHIFQNPQTHSDIGAGV
jgi:hypothetical protein